MRDHGVHLEEKHGFVDAVLLSGLQVETEDISCSIVSLFPPEDVYIDNEIIVDRRRQLDPLFERVVAWDSRRVSNLTVYG